MLKRTGIETDYGSAPMIAKKAPNPIDKHVGSRVRMRRMMLSMSQEKLGDALGLTFQQVQKYEKGTNRIGASRLQQISHILQVPVEFFFEGAPNVHGQPVDGMRDAPSPAYVSDFLRDLRRPGADQGFHAHQRRQAAPPHCRSGRIDRRRRRRRLSGSDDVTTCRPATFRRPPALTRRPPAHGLTPFAGRCKKQCPAKATDGS